MKLLPCPFCNSVNIDPEGWASTERAGPACDNCGGTANTIELWNTRKGEQAEHGVEDSSHNDREAHLLLDLICAEFTSDPLSVQCFDLQIVERVKICVAAHRLEE
jgi:hypothetical protein